MNLHKILTNDVITIDLKGDNKEEVIDSLIDLLVSAGKIKDRETVKKCIMEREAKMSTGMEAGIAIPHGKTDAVDELVGCVGIKKEGVDFDAFDKNPSRIFIMTVSPLHRTGPHVQFLAEISRLLKDQKSRDALVNAESVEEVSSIIFG